MERSPLQINVEQSSASAQVGHRAARDGEVGRQLTDVLLDERRQLRSLRRDGEAIELVECVIARRRRCTEEARCSFTNWIDEVVGTPLVFPISDPANVEHQLTVTTGEHMDGVTAVVRSSVARFLTKIEAHDLATQQIRRKSEAALGIISAEAESVLRDTWQWQVDHA